MSQRYYRRIIGGVAYVCQDIGCPDFEQAERNRRMVANKENITGYVQIEESVGRTPLNRPLPSWIPIGVVPMVAKEVWSALRGVPKDEFDTVLEEVMSVP